MQQTGAQMRLEPMDAWPRWMVPQWDRHKRITSTSLPASIRGVWCDPCWSRRSYIVLFRSFRHFMVSYAWDWQSVVTWWPLSVCAPNYLQLLQVHNFQHSLVLLLVFFDSLFFWLLHLHFKFLFVWQLFQIVICYCLEFILLLRLGNVCQPHVPPPPTHAATHNWRSLRCLRWDNSHERSTKS